ncbi:bifunctional glycosyltransferase family 2/GtrA family protein [Lachnospiraceae bacterium 54-53]
MAGENGMIIIPAYEPDERLIILLKRLHEDSDAALIVVNDGSSQGTEAVFEEAGIYATVLRHDRNYGKGRAIKTALEYLKNQKRAGEIATADGDGQHDVHDILLLLNKASLNRNALVIGSRSFHGDIPLRSRLGNQITRVMFRLMSGKWLKDTQTGLRAFDSSLIPRLLSVPGDRYEYETNVLLMCVKEQIHISEVLIRTIYLEGNQSSHFRVLKDSARICVNMFRFASSSFISFCADYIFFSLMLYITAGLKTAYAAAISNVTARLISAVLNYYLNKRYVFDCKENNRRSAVKYGILAAGILLVNTGLVIWLMNGLKINGWTAKLTAEVCLFFVSYLVQKLLVFK